MNDRQDSRGIIERGCCMNSRERLIKALKGGIPDRVPISTYELVGWNSDSFENQQESYRPLMDYIREKTDCIYMTGVSMVNRYVQEHTRVEKWREGKSTYIRVTLTTPKGELTKLDRIDCGINTVWHVEHFVKDDYDIEKYLSIPDDLVPVDTSHLKSIEEALGDKGIISVDIADPLCTAAELFHFGDFTVKAYTDTNTFIKLLDKIAEERMFFLNDMLKKGAGPLFRIVGLEYATPPYLSTEYFHKFVCNYDKKMIQLIHDYGKLARIHCHGRIKDALPHIVEMEADALDPVEAPPSGDIELKEVKRLYGSHFCIMGNIQLRDLETASEEEMRNITIKCMEAAKEGGGFIIMPTASPINVPLSPVTEKNYRVFIDTALEYGVYR